MTRREVEKLRSRDLSWSAWMYLVKVVLDIDKRVREMKREGKAKK